MFNRFLPTLLAPRAWVGPGQPAPGPVAFPGPPRTPGCQAVNVSCRPLQVLEKQAGQGMTSQGTGGETESELGVVNVRRDGLFGS